MRLVTRNFLFERFYCYHKGKPEGMFSKFSSTGEIFSVTMISGFGKFTGTYLNYFYFVRKNKTLFH